MILVTGASGQLGRLVVEELLKRVDADQIVAAVRSPEKVQDLAAQGVVVRTGDYSKPETLASAFVGVSKALLVSSSEVGQRFPQHKAVIDAAIEAGIELLAYTSLLQAPTNPMQLAAEHKATEEYLAQSGLGYALLRNGWYTENHFAAIPAAMQMSAVFGCAGEGQFNTAARADLAEAAAVVLTSNHQAGKVYELAGDETYTLADFAAKLGEYTGKAIVYQNLPEQEYVKALVGAGLPEAFAGIFADSDTQASKGYLEDHSKDLSTLLGRPTVHWAELLKSQL